MRPIVFLSDFGLDDEFVGVCHGVIARIASACRIIDLTHGVPPRDVLRGALVLADSVTFMPRDAVFLAVVDPGVGTDRAALAVESAAGQLLVGPDNGVLSLAWDRLGGPTRAVEVTSPAVLLPSVSKTFQGRDVFAPAAAHLAAGMPLDDLGPDVDPAGLTHLRLPAAEPDDGMLTCRVLGVDRFGNVQLNAREQDLEAAGLADMSDFDIRTVWQTVPVHRAATFGQIPDGGLGLVVDSRGWLAVVKNGGSASGSLRLGLGDPVVIERQG
jgi:S-adenosylmethionine hydrolase